jgi:hypothetical protein
MTISALAICGMDTQPCTTRRNKKIGFQSFSFFSRLTKIAEYYDERIGKRAIAHRLLDSVLQRRVYGANDRQQLLVKIGNQTVDEQARADKGDHAEAILARLSHVTWKRGAVTQFDRWGIECLVSPICGKSHAK